MNPHILDHIRIPRYNPADGLHRRLAELSKEAHAAGGVALPGVEAAIDRLAAQLWGLTEGELQAVRAALQTLGGDRRAESSTPPLWGLFADKAEMMDEIQREVYERRETDLWRLTDEAESAAD